MTELTQLQKEIAKAIEQLNQKTVYSEAILTKEIRKNSKIDGKPKAGLSVNDLEKVLSVLENDGKFYELHLNSANDLLIKKSNQTKFLEGDARHRRQSSEKSMSILTNQDFKSGGSNKPKAKRTERKKLNIYADYDE